MGDTGDPGLFDLALVPCRLVNKNASLAGAPVSIRIGARKSDMPAISAQVSG